MVVITQDNSEKRRYEILPRIQVKSFLT